MNNFFSSDYQPWSNSAIKVLIVDDSESDLLTYRRYLQTSANAQYKILEADNLEDGIQLWRSQSPDLVLVDINLPDGSGLELLEVVRASYPEYQKLPVISITGQGDERVAVQAMKLGASDYLVKEDITAISLSLTVNNVIEQQALSQKLKRLQQQESLTAQISLRIRQFLNLNEIYQAIVTEVRSFLNCDRVAVYKFNPDMSGVIVAESVIPPWMHCIDIQVNDTCFQKNRGGDYLQGKVSAISDIYTANLTNCYRSLLERFQIRANLVVPIIFPSTSDQEQILWGLLIAHQCSGPRSWKVDDLELLQRLSVQLAIALQQAELYQNLQNTNTALEQRTIALEASERRLKEAQQFARLGSWEMNAVTRECTWSNELFEIFRIDPRSTELSYDNLSQYFPTNQRALREELVQRAIQEQKPFESDFEIIRADGTKGYILTKCRPIIDELGQVTRLQGITLDISERKLAEEQLRESETLFRRVFESNIVGMMFTDFSGLITDANDRFLEIIGYDREDLEANRINWRTLTPPERLELDLKIIEPLQRDRSIRPWEKVYYHRDGHLVDVLVGVGLLSDDNDRRVSVVMDISDRKYYETQLKQKNVELETLVKLREETLTLREDMSNMIVHDLRNPLSGIILAAGIVHRYIDRVDQRDRLIKTAEKIMDSGKRLQRMIDSLLIMAKLESGKILLNPIATDLHQLGTEVIKDFELMANSYKVELCSELPTPGNTINIDETILRRVIDNLISNALKFSPMGGQVTLRLEYLPDDHLRLQVLDQGEGVNEERRQQIFQKFEIGELKQNVSQIGLGLAFCKLAVEAQGGTLAIAENPPQGSIFTVEI